MYAKIQISLETFNWRSRLFKIIYLYFKHASFKLLSNDSKLLKQTITEQLGTFWCISVSTVTLIYAGKAKSVSYLVFNIFEISVHRFKNFLKKSFWKSFLWLTIECQTMTLCFHWLAFALFLQQKLPNCIQYIGIVTRSCLITVRGTPQ